MTVAAPPAPTGASCGASSGAGPSDRPRWRGRLHAWAFVAAVPAGVVLLVQADRAAARAAVAVYAATLALVFGTSAAYHRLARSVRARAVMQRLDHSMIYLLIAGTYTPVCLLALPLGWGVPLLSVVGAGALVGMVLKLVDVHRFGRLGAWLYLGLGWAALVALPAMVVHVPAGTLALFVGGGVAYTAGAVVFGRRRPDPVPAVFGFHEVWHACTLVAGVCHFLAVWSLAVS